MSKRTPLAQLVGLAACLAVAFLTAGIGAIASIDAAGFYAQLTRPAWAPPPLISARATASASAAARIARRGV